MPIKQTPTLAVAVNLPGSEYQATPPDPSIAAGASAVVTVVNGQLTWYGLDGTQRGTTQLYTLFNGTAYGSDPRLVYDAAHDRFVVVALGNGTGSAAAMPLAVSKDGNPADGWYVGSINPLGANSLDYPSLAVDGNNIYVQVHAFNASGGFSGSNLYSVPIGLGSGGIYDGGAATDTVYTGANAGASVDGEPAAMFGAPAGTASEFLYEGAGFYLGQPGGVAYVTEVDDSTGTPSFVSHNVPFGTVLAASWSSFVAPSQPGTTQTIGTELGSNSVWRNGYLYCTQTYAPAAGPDAGVATVHWFKINTTTWTLADQGDVSGSLLGSGVATYDATIAVDAAGDFALNYTASGPNLYVGSYYSLHRAGDPAGSLEAAQPLHAGTASYDVTAQNSGRNRWGDYERSITAGPGTSGTFWMFNQYAAAPAADGRSVYGMELGSFAAPCFRQGTRIATAAGPVAVEHLRAGDLVRTAAGRLAPIRWLGSRHVDCARHPTPADVLPLRIAPGAFGPGLPGAPLWLSPDHAVFVGGALVPLRYLENGATIARETVRQVTYWHVELDRHDVVLAEGLPCESYLDTGNRAAFANAGPTIALHPDFATAYAEQVWAERACAPLLRSGRRLAALRRRLLGQARRLGHAIIATPDLQIAAGGGMLAPHLIAGPMHRFALPPGARELAIVSRSGVPALLSPTGQDHRRLGVAVERIILRCAGLRHAIGLDSIPANRGFHALERAGARAWRWTDGEARLVLPADIAAGPGRFLDLHIVAIQPSWAPVPMNGRRAARTPGPGHALAV